MFRPKSADYTSTLVNMVVEKLYAPFNPAAGSDGVPSRDINPRTLLAQDMDRPLDRDVIGGGCMASRTGISLSVVRGQPADRAWIVPAQAVSELRLCLRTSRHGGTFNARSRRPRLLHRQLRSRSVSKFGSEAASDCAERASRNEVAIERIERALRPALLCGLHHERSRVGYPGIAARAHHVV